jgi:hypothetical protein
MRFNCPHCDNAIDLTVTGADKGVDALGFPADQPGAELGPGSTVDTPTSPNKKLWRRAYIVPRIASIKHPDGRTYKTQRQEIMPAYYVGDNSWSDLFKKQFPRVQCKGL